MRGALAAGPALDQAVLLALSVAIGAAVYFTVRFEPGWTVVAAALGLSFVVYAVARRIWVAPVLSMVAVVFVGLSIGGALAKWRTQAAAAPVVAKEMAPALVEGWIVSIDQGGSGPRLTLEVHAISGLAPDQTPRRVRVTHTNSLEVAPGRFVRCYSVLRPPPAPSLAGDYDFRLQAWFRGLGAVGYVQGRCRGGTLGAPDGLGGRLMTDLSSLRRQLALYVNDAAGARAGGFAAALTSGDRSFMSIEDTEALRGAGLAHLLAISGLHMGIVGGLVYLIIWRSLALIEPLALRIAVQKPAALTALIASAAYLALSGASVSTQRAFIMAAIFFGAILIDRAALSLRSFAIAMMAVVAWHPESVMSPGFQMSFAATGALIVTYEAWNRQRREAAVAKGMGIIFTMNSLVVTSIVGAAATAPFALFHFGRVAAFGLIANVLAMPVISFATAPLAAAAMISAPFGFSAPVLRLFGASLEVVLAVAHAFDGEVEGLSGVGPPMPSTALLASIAGLAAMVVFKGRLRGVVMGASLGLCAVLWVTGPRALVHWAPSGDVYILQEDGGHLRVGFVDGDGLGPLRFVDLDQGAVCDTSRCSYTSAAGSVTLHSGEPRTLTCKDLGAGLHLFARGEETYCPGSLTWSEAERLGGQTLRLWPSGGIERERPNTCAPRVWAPCNAP
ncbi:MAG: ComEC/Rec2 family competence protein [Pseudomonadota bacterium]